MDDTTVITELGESLADQGSTQMADVATAEGTRRSTLRPASLPETTLVVVDADTLPHPTWFTAAVPAEGAAIVLSGFPQRWDALVEATPGARVTSSDEARELAIAYLDTTRPSPATAYRVSSAGEVRLRPSATASDRARIAEADITGPAVRTRGEGWQVTVSMVAGPLLTTRILDVGPDARIEDRSTIAVRDLPVPVAR